MGEDVIDGGGEVYGFVDIGVEVGVWWKGSVVDDFFGIVEFGVNFFSDFVEGVFVVGEVEESGSYGGRGCVGVSDDFVIKWLVYGVFIVLVG